MRAALESMRASARGMSVRTMAQLDVIVRRHVLDARRVVEVMGADDTVKIGVEVCWGFYARAVEREEEKKVKGKLVPAISLATTTSRESWKGPSEEAYVLHEGEKGNDRNDMS